jgi:uncharacterized protein
MVFISARIHRLLGRCALIIDAHTHIFPPRVRLNRERFLTPHETAFHVIYRDPKAALVEADELVAAMDECGVDRAITFGFPWAGEETARMHNDYVAWAQERYPDRLIGLACFDPLTPWAVREAERALDCGLKGLGELAVYNAGFNEQTIKNFEILAGLCRERDLPLMVHVNEPIGHDYPGKAPLTLKEIYALIKAASGVKLILAHWGGGVFFYNLLKKEVPASLANVYFDTAASPFLYQPQIYDLAVRIIGAEKILFGSDFPLLKPSRYFKEIDAAGISRDAASLIKGRNAERLFR